MVYDSIFEHSNDLLISQKQRAENDQETSYYLIQE